VAVSARDSGFVGCVERRFFTVVRWLHIGRRHSGGCLRSATLRLGVAADFPSLVRAFKGRWSVMEVIDHKSASNTSPPGEQIWRLGLGVFAGSKNDAMARGFIRILRPILLIKRAKSEKWAVHYSGSPIYMRRAWAGIRGILWREATPVAGNVGNSKGHALFWLGGRLWLARAIERLRNSPVSTRSWLGIR
jgi:hypothetical protein